MYFVPFIYFCGLAYYFWWKHKTFDLAVYMSVLFSVTSLCCILMVLSGHIEGSGVLADGWMPEFEIIPTLLYCTLVTITIIPFSFVRPEKFEHINNPHRNALYAFALFILFQGAVVYYLVGGFLSNLLNGDFKFLKDAGYDGDITPADAMMQTMPLPIQFLYMMCSITLLGIPLFFYYSCVEKRSLWLTAPLLAVSISPVLRGVLSADRTEIIHYGLMFLFCLVLFQRFITKRVRNFVLVASVPVLLAGGTYVIAVSASRFEDTKEGAGGSMLEYAGQAYSNFCYFYENHNSDLYYFEREFPLTSYFVFKTQYTETKDERSAKEGFFVGVFASHVGSWLLDAGVVGATVLSLLFALLCCWVIRRYDRIVFDIGDLFMIFILAAVPVFGIFYYRYYSISTTFVCVPVIFFYMYSKLNFVWKAENEETTEKI